MTRLSENVPDNLIDYHHQFSRYVLLLEAIETKFDDCFSDHSVDSGMNAKLEDLYFLINVLADYLEIQESHLKSLIDLSHNGYLLPKMVQEYCDS
jgi:hypothetical protein